MKSNGDRSALVRVEKEFAREVTKQAYIVYGQALIALHDNWGFRRRRLTRVMRAVQEAWKQVSDDISLSAIRQLDEEIGLELKANPYGKSYKELDFLNGNGSEGDGYVRVKNVPQAIFLRRRQMEWLGAQVTAVLFTALHREYGFGFVRLSRVLEQMQNADCPESVQLIEDTVKERTAIDIKEFIGG